MSEMILTQIELPRVLVKSLQERSAACGLTLAQQIREALTAYLTERNEPILQADDALFQLAGVIDSGVGDLAARHDYYLYQKSYPEALQ
ncbi:MAG TPA: ribbon-helix-helix protein, CopG family [Thermoflexia bacterium]|nr:ribbon-helix-helix protein, CopG family [Thermoflexia bacterium]